MRGRRGNGGVCFFVLGLFACATETFPLGEPIVDGPDASTNTPPDAAGPVLGAPDVGNPHASFPPGCAPVEGYLLCLRTAPQAAARDLCRRVGGDLVVIETREENELIGRIVAAWTPNTMWIGLTDAETEDSWVWGDGRPLEGFDAWLPGEPNDLEGEDCAHINWLQEPGGWNDQGCTDAYGAVCEFPPGRQVSCLGDQDCVFSVGRCVGGSCVVQPP